MQNVIIELFNDEGKLLLPSTSVPIELTPTNLSDLIQTNATFYLNGQPITESLKLTLNYQQITEFEGTFQIFTFPNQKKVDTNFCSESYSGHESAILTIASSNDLLVSAGGDSTIRLWCKTTKTQKKIIKSHQGVIYSLSIKDNKIVSSGSDGKIVIYNSDGDVLNEILAHKKGVINVKFDGKKILSAGRDNFVKLWTEDLNCEFNYSHEKPVTCIHYSKDFIISGSRDGKLKIFKGTTFLKEFNHFSSINCLAVNNKFIILGCEDGKIYCYAVSEEINLITTFQHNNSVISLSISANGLFFCSGSFDKKVRIYSLNPFKVLGEYNHTSYVYKVECCGDRIISCGKDKCVMVFDIGTMSLISRFVCKDEIYDFVVLDDKIICGGRDRNLYFFG